MSIDEMMALRDVKTHLSEVIDQVEGQRARVTITRHGKPAAVLISADDLASLEETLAVMSDPVLVTDLRDSRTELAEGPAEILTKDQILARVQQQ